MAEDVKDEAHPDIISKTPLEHARLVRRTRDDASQSTGEVAQSLSSSATQQQHDSTIRKLQFHSSLENKSKRARRDK